MTNFTIEKNIPLPTIATTAQDFPFEDMEVGDSFSTSSQKRSSLRNHATRYENNNPGIKFTLRQIDKENVRIWRIS